MVTKQTLDYYNWNDLVDSAEHILGKDLRDYADCMSGGGHYIKWCKSVKGMSDQDLHDSSKDWAKIHKEYEGQIDSGLYPPEPPYQDFWHWWLDNTMYGECNNGHYQHGVCIDELLVEHLDAEPWVLEILKTFQQILRNDSSKEITIHHWW